MKRVYVIVSALLLAGCAGQQEQPPQIIEKAVAVTCTPKSPRAAPPYADAAIAAAPNIGVAAQELKAGVQQRDARILSLETDLESCSGGKW
jgi:hypothetical protein